MKKIFKNIVISILCSIGIYSSINFFFNKNNVTTLKIKTDYFYFYMNSHPLKGKKIKYRILIKKKGVITTK